MVTAFFQVAMNLTKNSFSTEHEGNQYLPSSLLGELGWEVINRNLLIYQFPICGITKESGFSKSYNVKQQEAGSMKSKCQQESSQGKARQYKF